MSDQDDKQAPDRTFAIVIVAAGRGERAGSDKGPKQYRMIGGKAVIARTVEAFSGSIPEARIVAVIHEDDHALFEAALGGINADQRIITVNGGATRQASVLAGLEALADAPPDFVLIHDAARPFVSEAVIQGVTDHLLRGDGAVLPAVAVADTLKRCDDAGFIVETVSRQSLYGAQTPQGFAFQSILKAHRRARDAGRTDFTDDCAIAEWDGVPVRVTEGSAANIKLTTAEDIVMADQRLEPPVPDIRTGNGYDVHRLVPGDFVTLCGIEIPHTMRLDGHSDADVALHALTDALLATCGAGDIGDHFPPSDPQWKGAPSSIFLEHAAAIVRKRGGRILNADISLIAEAPRVGPHRQAMRENLSRMLAIPVERCSVKATTNEKLGFAGRGEGIAAIATASVYFGPVS